MSSLKPLDYPESSRSVQAGDPFSVPLLTFLIEFLRPNLFVEIGIEKGDSFFACCRAVKELGLHTRCYGISTLEADKECETVGGKNFADLKKAHDVLYEGFSQLVESRIDDASKVFADGAIDLLYLRGQCSYDALQKILNVWLAKMSDRGAILLDNINVRGADGGVSRFWEEIRSVYPHFELIDDNGLGLIAVGNLEASALGRFMLIAHTDTPLLNLIFRQLGHSLTVRAETEQQVNELIKNTKEQDLRINSLSAQLAATRQEFQSLSEKWQADYKRLLLKWGAQQREAVEDKENVIRSLSSALLKEPEERRKLYVELKARDTQLKAKEIELEAIANELIITRTRLENILASRAWRWVTRYGRIKLILLAPLSRLFNRRDS